MFQISISRKEAMEETIMTPITTNWPSVMSIFPNCNVPRETTTIELSVAWDLLIKC